MLLCDGCAAGFAPLGWRAGFQANDIVLGWSTITFYRSLELAHGGRALQFEVASYSDNGPLTTRPRRLIRLHVP